MSYSVLITRDTSWPFCFGNVDSPVSRIALLEWNDVVESDPSLTSMTNSFTTDWFHSGVPVADSALNTDCDVLRTQCDNPEMTIEYFPHFGVLVVSNPTKEILDKAIQLAGRLAAVVRGKEGEFLTESSQLFSTGPTKDHSARDTEARASPFWIFTNAGFFLAGVFAARYIAGGSNLLYDIAGGLSAMAVLTGGSLMSEAFKGKRRITK